MGDHLVWIGRIALATVLGGIIGYERDRRGKPVGFRTHLLVAMASATFMVVSPNFVHFHRAGPGDDLMRIDGARIAGSVVTGIGFLAGGAILRSGFSVHGLTTAAGLWLVTAIGLASGGGMYPEAVAVTALGMATLTVVRRLEEKDRRQIHRRISVVLADGSARVSQVEQALNELGTLVSDVEYESRLEGDRSVTITFDVQVPVGITIATLAGRLERLEGIRGVHVQRSE